MIKGLREQQPLKISNSFSFSLFDCLRGDSKEREDPGQKSKIFQNYE